MVIFWNFAGVPFVNRIYALYPEKDWVLTDILLLNRIHGISWPFQISILDYWLCRTLRQSSDRLLHVCKAFQSFPLFDMRSNLVGIHLCRKRAGSKCKPKELSNSAIPSLNYHGELSKTLVSFKPPMGTSSIIWFRKFLNCCQEIVCSLMGGGNMLVKSWGFISATSSRTYIILSELHRRLVAKLHVGTGCWNCYPDSLFLFCFLHHCTYSSVQ